MGYGVIGVSVPLNTDFAVFLLGRHTKGMQGVFIGGTTMGWGGGGFIQTLVVSTTKKKLRVFPQQRNKVIFFIRQNF